MPFDMEYRKMVYSHYYKDNSTSQIVVDNEILKINIDNLLKYVTFRSRVHFRSKLFGDYYVLAGFKKCDPEDF